MKPLGGRWGPSNLFCLARPALKIHREEKLPAGWPLIYKGHLQRESLKVTFCCTVNFAMLAFSSWVLPHNSFYPYGDIVTQISSSNRHLTLTSSYRGHLTEGILHGTSYMVHLTWDISQGTSHMGHLTWDISHGTSHMGHLTWDISHGTSHMGHLTWDISHGNLTWESHMGHLTWDISHGTYHMGHITWDISHGTSHMGHLTWDILHGTSYMGHLTWGILHGNHPQVSSLSLWSISRCFRLLGK